MLAVFPSLSLPNGHHDAVLQRKLRLLRVKSLAQSYRTGVKSSNLDCKASDHCFNLRTGMRFGISCFFVLNEVGNHPSHLFLSVGLAALCRPSLLLRAVRFTR